MKDRSRLTHLPRPGAVVAVLAFAGMGASFMQTILVPIQSELPKLLGAAREDTAWVITVTLLVSAIFTPISGKLGDMYGKRRIAIILLALLIAGSVICALSSTVIPMIVGRALQGTGMGVIPLGISILRDTLHPDRLGSSIALVSATLGVGGALGLPISAFVTENFDWHALFFVAAAIGAISLVLFIFVIPPSTLRTPGRFDLLGAIGLAIGLTGIMLTISKGNEWGWLTFPTLISGGIGIVALLIWGAYQWRHVDPLVDLRVSVRGPVLMTNLASIAMGFALFSSSIVFPQLLELPRDAGGLGMPLLTASFALMPSGLAMLAMSPIAGRLIDRIGPKSLLIVGAVVIAVTYAFAVFLPATVWSVAISNTFIGVGIGLGYAAMPTLIMRAVPSTETGAANGLNTLMRSLGTSIAAAAVAAVLAQSAGATGFPTPQGFQLALVYGLVAAVVCAVLASLIPRSREGVEAHPSLPGE
ncbi:MFS transporter [Leucobacter luti]|uniref:MFS transporter n=1 Tax=Leucobacter luti TaxID=340320 RepID=UPI003D0780EA